MSAVSAAKRTQLLSTIMTYVTQQINSLFDQWAAQPPSSWPAVEHAVHQLSHACLLPALLTWVEQQRPQVELPTVVCPCGQPCRAKGAQPRTLLTRLGPLTFRRGYYYCPACRRGHYPLDGALGLDRSQFSDGVQEGVCQLAVHLPFAHAASVWTTLTGLPISDREVARLTQERGRRLEVHQATEQRQALSGTLPPSPQPRALQPQGPGVWVAALDAARVCFRDDWHEIKAGVIGWAQPLDHPAAAADAVQTRAASYITSVAPMAGAGVRLYTEAVRRGIDPSQDLVVCVGDGAASIWDQFATHFPHRVEVLDWYHAVEHLWAAGNGLYGEGSGASAGWVAARKEELWAGQVEAVLAALQEAAATERTGAAAAAQVHYFTTNQERMRYARYRARGYPVGSGIVESACKQVIGARAKGAGMRWSQTGVQEVLTLRAELLSGRWPQAWATTRATSRPA